MSRLLTDEKLKAIEKQWFSDLAKDIGLVWESTIPQRVAKAQDAETLKAVGGWLQRQLAPEDTWFISGRGFVEALLRGEMPEG